MAKPASDMGDHDHAAMMANSADTAAAHVVNPQSDQDLQMMDHSGHDMKGMDHGSMGAGHMMSMYFHFGVSETILFSFWKIDSVIGLVGSMVGIFLLTVFYESLKVYREYLLHYTLTKGAVIRNQSATRKQCCNQREGNNGATLLADNPEEGQGNGQRPGPSDEVVVVRNVLRPHPLSWPHMLQTGLHVIQLVISYFLMLIFMTYNVWLCLAVALGAGAGYFAFGWRKKTVIDVNECCLTVSCGIVFLFAILAEALKHFQRQITTDISDGKLSTKYSTIQKPQPNSFPWRMRSFLNKCHFTQTLLYVIQVCLSYCLMMIFMTFNVCICVSVTLGLGLGYFLFEVNEVK